MTYLAERARGCGLGLEASASLVLSQNARGRSYGRGAGFGLAAMGCWDSGGAAEGKVGLSNLQGLLTVVAGKWEKCVVKITLGEI